MTNVLQVFVHYISLYLAKSFRDEALTAATVKIPVSWDVTPCSQASYPRNSKTTGYENFHPQTRTYVQQNRVNPLASNDIYTLCRIAQLTSRCRILNIYSTNTLTEYFKHAAHSPFFFSLSSRCRLFHNAIFFGSCIIHILNTECAKVLKKFWRPRVNATQQTHNVAS